MRFPSLLKEKARSNITLCFAFAGHKYASCLYYCSMCCSGHICSHVLTFMYRIPVSEMVNVIWSYDLDLLPNNRIYSSSWKRKWFFSMGTGMYFLVIHVPIQNWSVHIDLLVCFIFYERYNCIIFFLEI